MKNKEWLINKLNDLVDSCQRAKNESYGQDEIYYQAKVQAYKKAVELTQLLETNSTSESKVMMCKGCKHYGNWENEYEYGYLSPCTGCSRRLPDNYEVC